MNRKQFTTIIVIGILLGGLGLLTMQKSSRTWTSSGQGLGQKVLPNFPANDVAAIVIKQTASELNLVKQDDRWEVKERAGYPANFPEIRELLTKLWELKMVRTEQVGPSQLPRLELQEPGKGDKSGTSVEFKDKDGKVVASLLLGKNHMRGGGGEDASPFGGGGGGWPDGRYLLVPGKTQVVGLVADALNNVEPKPESWINKDFFKIEKIRSVAVTATNSWKLARETETGEMKLADLKEGEQLDTGKASSVGSAFSYPSFDDVLPPDTKPDDTGLDKAVAAHIETFENFAYDLKIGNKVGTENYFLTVSVSADLPKERTPGKDEKPEDKDKLDKEFKEKADKLKEKLEKEKALEKWIFKVSKWTVDPVLKDRSQLFAEKKTDAKAGTDTTPSGNGPVPPAEPDDDENALPLGDPADDK